MQYKSYFKEQDNPDWYDDKATDLISYLKDNNFGNEDSRKALLDVLTSLHTMKDKRAKKVFKAIGDLFTDIGDEIIKYGQEVNGEE